MESSQLGVILDTSVLIAGERSGRGATSLIRYLDRAFDGALAGMSAISAVELTHGIYRAKQVAQRERRLRFAEEILKLIPVHSVTLDIALLAGRIHGEQMSLGISIDLADLLIGCTALHLRYDVATLNTDHFTQIPNLRLVPMPETQA